ncbi:MAG: hypothetical protein Q8R82_12800 [Hyphomonadaceae bacterium]|nr:hypothetical protein [Hyphomonadaceae bacterium]
MALLARLSVDDKHYNAREFDNALRGVKNNQPEFVPRPAAGAIEIRKILRTFGLTKSADMFAEDLNVALLDAEQFRKLDPLFGKMFCALHYMHTGKIIPASTPIFRQCVPNQVRAMKGGFEFMDYPMMQGKPTIARNGKSLTDQFDYRWNVDSAGTFGFKFHLRHSVYGVMLGPLEEAEIGHFSAQDVLRL